MICSGVNRTLPIETPFSQVFSHYTWTDFRGAGHLFLNKPESLETYKDNVAFTVKRVSEIIKFMENYQLEATKLLAKARILLKETKQRIFLIGAHPRRHYGKSFNKCLEEELAILEKEIELTRRQSQKEIDRIKKSPV
jgi:UDP-N-acetylglucosamine 2-epimerase